MKYRLFNPNEIHPQGWMKRQLEIQADGLSGNLDLVWPDVRDSAWIGGACEGWERVPYWLDGFIPLAWLLNRADLKARAKRYIDAIVARQQEDGWICPCKQEERARYDMWAHLLIGKVLALYVDFTGDEQVEKALYRAMRCLYNLLADGSIKLFDWGKFRWYEGIIPLAHLCERGREDWMLALADMLFEQGAYYDDYTDTWVRPMNEWTQWTHIVNMGMMLKAQAVYNDLFGRPAGNQAERHWKLLDKYNGTVVGTFNGDECLSGLENNQGFELCSVTELMYSCEQLYAITGDPVWAQRLERAAFNAMPATNSDDMWTHQYDQQVNQIACKTFPGRSIFRTNGPESHLFGLEPNYGCCTANFNQGWPKLAMNAFLRSEHGVHCPMMTPAALTTELSGVPVTITMDTAYPFRLGCKYTVTAAAPVEFELTARIPAWTESLHVNGYAADKTDVLTLGTKWEGTTEITVTLSSTPHFVRRPHNLRAVEWGTLVFALPIRTEYRMLEFTRNGVERKFPYCDYELLPCSEWRYGFENTGLTVEERPLGDCPFSSTEPPVVIHAEMAQVAWDYADGFDSVAASHPRSNTARSAAESMELYPYGCAKLRMTEMPLVRRK